LLLLSGCLAQLLLLVYLVSFVLLFGWFLVSVLEVVVVTSCFVLTRKCVYVQVSIVLSVTKVVSRKKKSILEFAGTWKGDDIDEVFLQVKKDREQSASRHTGM
jgi:hypothetical protein